MIFRIIAFTAVILFFVVIAFCMLSELAGNVKKLNKHEKERRAKAKSNKTTRY